MKREEKEKRKREKFSKVRQGEYITRALQGERK